MFEITYGDLRNPEFKKGLKRLGDVRALPNKSAYNIAKIIKAIEAEAEIYRELADKLVEPFLEMKNGKPIQLGGPGNFKVVEGLSEELNAALKEFHKTTVRIDRPKVKLEDVAKDLSPREILALEALWLPVSEME